MSRHGGVLCEPSHGALELGVHVADGKLTADDVGHRRVGEVLEGHEHVGAVVGIDVAERVGRQRHERGRAPRREAVFDGAFGHGQRRTKVSSMLGLRSQTSHTWRLNDRICSAGVGPSSQVGRNADVLALEPLTHRDRDEPVT